MDRLNENVQNDIIQRTFYLSCFKFKVVYCLKLRWLTICFDLLLQTTLNLKSVNPVFLRYFILLILYNIVWLLLCIKLY